MPEDLDLLAPYGEPQMEAVLEAHARAGSCPCPDLLFAAEDRVLPDIVGDTIREHASRCVLCKVLLKGLAPTRSSFSPGQKARIRARIDARIESEGAPLAGADEYVVPPSPSDFIPIVAIVVLVLSSLLVFRWIHRTPTAHVPPTAVMAGTTEELGPLPAPVETIPDGGAPDADLQVAFRAYSSGDFAAAAADFDALTKRYPNSDVPLLYMGVSQLELNRNADAKATLTRAEQLATPMRRDTARWFLAVVSLRAGDTLSATPLLHAVCGSAQSIYAARACVLARQQGARP